MVHRLLVLYRFRNTANRKLGSIFGHILGRLVCFVGNVWANHWDNIQNLVQPYPNSSYGDVTKRLKEQACIVQEYYGRMHHGRNTNIYRYLCAYT